MDELKDFQISTIEIGGVLASLRAMRHPKESYHLSDSLYLEEDNFYINHSDKMIDYGLKSAIYVGDEDFRLFKNLSNCKPGTGHDCCLKGIQVWAEIRGNHAFWPQFQRYHFSDIISSQSKMHCIVKKSIDKKCGSLVSPITKRYVDSLIAIFNGWEDGKEQSINIGSFGEELVVHNKEQLYEAIIQNTPIGYMLVASVMFNYLQLKTIISQRKGHKMGYWHDFCNWAKTLPFADDLLFGVK